MILRGGIRGDSGRYHDCLFRRVGTGGSSGEHYLQGAVNKNYIFKELAGVITFLIERRHLPALPSRLRQALRFSFTSR